MVAFLDSLLNPILVIPKIWLVLGMSLIISLITVLVYKFATNQKEMKRLKDEIKEHQKQAREASSDTSKMLEINKKAMSSNMEYMRHSMKAMLFTFIPVILFFGWMAAHLAYEPIKPSQEFIVTASFDKAAVGNAEIAVPDGVSLKSDKIKDIIHTDRAGIAEWKLSGDLGKHTIEIKYEDKPYVADVLISDGVLYSEPIVKVKSSLLKEIKIGNEKSKMLNLFGWEFGWFWTYVFSSILFSLGLRKAFKVY